MKDVGGKLHVSQKTHSELTYIQGVLTAIHEARDFLSSGTSIVLGDFNGNPFWDKGGIVFSDVVNALRTLGLVSAYHHHHGLPHGNEPHATYYHQWKEEQPFHIDYCFMPPSLLKGATVEVGSFSDWEGISDHRPLSVRLL